MSRKLADLQQIYKEADECDKEIFAEMRSNIRLVSGEHYAKKNSRFFNRLRDTKQLNDEQKLRITKNHIQKISKTYWNAIISHAPSTIILPKNEKELRDQKAAELNNSMWEDLKDKVEFKSLVSQWAKDFIDLGECATKIFQDPNAGALVGYQPELVEGPDGEMVPQIGEDGQVVMSKTAIFQGQICFDRIHGFNLLRCHTAKTMKESPYLIYRKLVPISELKKMVGKDEVKQKMIQQSAEDVYTVFDGGSGNYADIKGMCMVKEIYWRVSVDYPKGAWDIFTDGGILFDDNDEGLPFGVFPIEYEGFDEVQTTPRHRSIIKVARPYQAEINRAASKIAETQITSDDKLILSSGSKMSPGGTLPGIRAVSVTGQAQVLPGRAGEQYAPYVDGQISEMYMACNCQEEAEDVTGATDPMLVIFKSMVHKKKFLPYAEKFEGFIRRVTKKGLALRKGYAQEQEIIPIIGRSEQVNIPEFKSSTDINLQIKVEPCGEEIHTQMGKQIIFQNILQYVGSTLDKESIGLIIRQMPWVTKDSAFAELTLDYDCVTNDILALDRGIPRPAEPDDDHPYYIKRLTNRMKQGDFEFLDPQIQQLYAQKKQEHEQIKTQQTKAIQAAKDGFIPTDGYLVKITNFMIPDPNNPQKTTYLQLPYSAIKWLKDKLDAQGSEQQDLVNMNQGSLAEMAGMLLQNHGGMPMPGGPPNGGM